MAVAVGIPLLAFAATTAIAELAGAANLGTAMGFGQIAFALALVAMMLRRSEAGASRPAPPAAAPRSAGRAASSP